MARKSKLGEISKVNKMRPYAKSIDALRDERDVAFARLLNFKNGTPVEMRWNMNQATIADQIFILKVGQEEVMLSAEDMMRFLRWV